MFKGDANVSFQTDKPAIEVFKNVENQLCDVAPTEISDNGVIKINAAKYNTFGSTCSIDGTIRERGGKYTIDLEYEQKPNALGWILAICTGGILFLFLVIMFFNSKSEIGKKMDKILSSIRMDYK